MKKLNFLFVLLITLFSCSNDSEESIIDDTLGTWELTKMGGSVSNSQFTGAEMEWQESYTLNVNGIFLKSRERDGVITEISGTYTIINYSNESLLELTYSNESNIVGSCYSQLKEELSMKSNILMISTWHYCDGPKLTYEKVK